MKITLHCPCCTCLFVISN